MPTNAIPNGYDFAYRGRNAGTALELHRWLYAISDNLQNRIARHVYIKKDGAEKEPMGAGDGSFRFRLSVVGDDCAAQYRVIVVYLRNNPQGTLTHPLLGEIKVACEGIEEGAIDVVNASNVVNVSIKFSEDAVDTAITSNDLLSPNTAAGALTIQSARLGILSTIASVAALASYAASKAVEFASACLAAHRALTGTTGLDKQLGDVRAAAKALEAAILTSPAFASEADRWDPIDAARQTAAAALDLFESVQRSGPRIVPFTVKQTMPVTAIAVALYGKDGAAYIDQILGFNRIPNPFAVVAGTVLYVSQPTV